MLLEENPEYCNHFVKFFKLLHHFWEKYSKIPRFDMKSLLQVLWTTVHTHLNLVTKYVKYRVSFLCFKNIKNHNHKEKIYLLTSFTRLFMFIHFMMTHHLYRWCDFSFLVEKSSCQSEKFTTLYTGIIWSTEFYPANSFKFYLSYLCENN